MAKKILILLFVLPFCSAAQEAHQHSAPEVLGKVSFPISCTPAVQQQFERGVALLHSFAYSAAENAFQGVADQDHQCAMADRGMAMTHFHQLRDPPIRPQPSRLPRRRSSGRNRSGMVGMRQLQFINALALIYQDAAKVPYRTRALNYEQAMSSLAAANRKDTEAQVFYALALLANESPTDRTHAKQNRQPRCWNLCFKLTRASRSTALPDPCVRQCGASPARPDGGEAHTP